MGFGVIIIAILAILLVLCLIVAYWGQMIYGGIWWGRLDSGAKHAGGRARQFWQTTLAMWVCSLVLPFFAPWVCACILASWTTTKGYEKFQNSIGSAILQGDQRVFAWFMDCTKGRTDIEGCMKRVCTDPRKYMLAWSIMGGIGMIGGLFIKYIRRIAKR